jgi:hypothetical protein
MTSSSSSGRLRRAAVVAALVVMGTAGCSTAPPSPIAQAPATTPVSSPSHTVHHHTPVRRQPGRVTFPWSAGKPQLGIQIYWKNAPGDSDSAVLLQARRMITYVTSLDANSIVISFPVYTAGPYANAVYASDYTPTPARMDPVIRLAQAAGLRVTLRPLLDETSLTAAGVNYWRGNIEPSDRSAWFVSYASLVAPYLVLAQQDKVNSFVLGTEFTSLQDDPRWDGIASRARSLYTGQLTYSDNWDVYVQQRVGVPVDLVGVDAYPPMDDLGGNATVAQLVAGWNHWLDNWTSSPLPDSIFYEVGAPAEKGAYQHPGSWGDYDSSTLDLSVQANWFTAACQVAQDRDMAGVYWWRYSLQQNPADADPLHDRTDSWVGRPAAGAIRTCFDTWAAWAY